MVIQERFQYSSGETISQWFHKVLNALVLRQRPLCVQLVTINYLSNRTLKSEKIQNTDLIFGYCLDALDETHSILAHIPYANQILYHIEIEKDFLSQNILAAVYIQLTLFMIVESWLTLSKIRDLFYQKKMYHIYISYVCHTN